jgi:hypothetical protein
LLIEHSTRDASKLKSVCGNCHFDFPYLGIGKKQDFFAKKPSAGV